jgi:predicted metal-dependent peptidase
MPARNRRGNSPQTQAKKPATIEPATRTDVQIREQARLKMLAARIRLDTQWPYLASLCYSLRLVEAAPNDVPTMAVDDGWRMYYNPYFVDALNVDELATVVLHECMHCILQHAKRFRSLVSIDATLNMQEDPEYFHGLWNVAGDCSINETLHEMGVTWPAASPPLRFAQFSRYGLHANQITETAFFKLVENLVEAEQEPLDCDCGSISDGSARGYEIPKDDALAPHADSDQQDRVMDTLAGAIAAARDQGNVPSALKRWADDRLDPKIDWRRQLAVNLRRAIAFVAGRRDYSYARPSRRQSAMHTAGSTVILPAMRQPAPPRVAIVADTSGSIQPAELNQFIGEISGMIRAVGLSQGIFVIPCDAKAHSVIRLKSSAAIDHIEFVGGGGTDMGAGIFAAAEINPKPHIVVVLTDGYTPWPDRKPRGIEYVIAALTDPDTLRSVPDWIQTVVIED